MTTVSFTGDISFSKYFKNAWQDPSFIDRKIVDFLGRSDYVVANVECPLSGGDISVSNPLTHASDPKAATCLKHLNANIWTIANNHILDCGATGLEDTLRTAKEYNCRTVGAGLNKNEAAQPIILDQAGGIGIFAVTAKIRAYLEADENTPGCIIDTDTAFIRESIRKIKKQNRWCIVIAHGGEEFASIPVPCVRKLYRKYLEYGADIVVGHHPHVTQNYETVGDKIIFYSLGNFIFDTDYQRIQNNTEYGILLKLQFDEKVFSWEHLPIRIDRETQTVTVGKRPDIFCDIPPKEYNKLRPLGVKTFFINNKRARCFNDPTWKSKPAKAWFDHYASRFTKAAVVRMHIDEWLCRLRFWKLADKKLYTYLLNSVKEEK